MSLPTNRTADSTIAEHTSDHNTLAAGYNANETNTPIPAMGAALYVLRVDAAGTALEWAAVVVDDDIATFAWSGTLTVGTGTGRFPFPFAATLLGVSAAINTAPTGASAIFDVNKNGTTIYTTQGNRPTIAISAFAAAETVPDVIDMAIGDYLTVDRDQIGSSVAGSDATVLVRYRRT